MEGQSTIVQTLTPCWILTEAHPLPISSMAVTWMMLYVLSLSSMKNNGSEIPRSHEDAVLKARPGAEVGHQGNDTTVCLPSPQSAGTRAGRATWLYFALWALLLIVNELLVHTLHVVPLSTLWPVFMGFALLSPLILLLNRLDRSGSTIEEVKEAAEALAATKEAEIKSTLPYRLGRWTGKWVGRYVELIRIVNIFSKRIAGISVGGWLGVCPSHGRRSDNSRLLSIPEYKWRVFETPY
jgi:hypothetical protein